MGCTQKVWIAKPHGYSPSCGLTCHGASQCVLKCSQRKAMDFKNLDVQSKQEEAMGAKVETRDQQSWDTSHK
jgi:hypothetical protein